MRVPKTSTGNPSNTLSSGIAVAMRCIDPKHSWHTVESAVGHTSTSVWEWVGQWVNTAYTSLKKGQRREHGEDSGPAGLCGAVAAAVPCGAARQCGSFTPVSNA